MFRTKHSKILKSIAKDHQGTKQMNEYKILELKCGNTKLLGNTKYKKVKLVFLVFAFCLFVQVRIKLY